MSNTIRTSGTTGAPKEYEISAALLKARVDDIARIRPPGWAGLASLYNDFADRPGVLRDRAWAQATGKKLFRPLATFEATVAQFVDNQIEGVFAAPAGLLRFAAALGKTTYRPKIVVSSAAILLPSVSQTIRAGMGDNLWTIYSAGECGGISMATAAQAEAVSGCVGKPFAGVEIQIVGREIQVKTPIMIEGYADPATTKDRIVDGWFRTGDAGQLEDDGMLVYEGRL